MYLFLVSYNNLTLVQIRSYNRTYNLVDYERPEGDYLVLESLN